MEVYGVYGDGLDEGDVYRAPSRLCDKAHGGVDALRPDTSVQPLTAIRRTEYEHKLARTCPK